MTPFRSLAARVVATGATNDDKVDIMATIGVSPHYLMRERGGGVG